MLTSRTPLLYSFESPHNLRETTELVVRSIIEVTATETRSGWSTMELLDTPPMMATVYFSTIEDDRVVVTAGNKVQTYWQMIFDLTPRGSVVLCEVNLDRRKKDLNMWRGDVHRLMGVVNRLHFGAGCTILKQEF